MSYVGADELLLVVIFGDGLDTIDQRRQTVWAVTKPEVVLVVVGWYELVPGPFVNKHDRHLTVSQGLDDELLGVEVQFGVDNFVWKPELVELCVGTVALHARVLAEHGDSQHDCLLVYI